MVQLSALKRGFAPVSESQVATLWPAESQVATLWPAESQAATLWPCRSRVDRAGLDRVPAWLSG